MSIVLACSIFCVSCMRESPGSVFEDNLGIKIPDGALLKFERVDDTEMAFVWEVPSGVESFELPDGLSYEKGGTTWEKPWFGYYGELPEGEITQDMVFKVVRMDDGTIAIGKDVETNRIAFSLIDSGR